MKRKEYIGVREAIANQFILRNRVYIREVNENRSTCGIYALPHVNRHSPDGFGWGYNGSGPSDLALSILTDLIGLERAEARYMEFRNSVIALLPEDGFRIPEESIRIWLGE